MRIVVLGGAGAMGRVTVADLARSTGVEEVRIADVNRAAAETLAREIGGPARAGYVPGAYHLALVEACGGADVVVNATSHKLNVPVMRACLEVHAHYTDLGGLYWWALDQLSLDREFQDAGLSAAISFGAAPGITNMLAAAACERLDSVESIEVIDAVVPGRTWSPTETYVPPYAPDTLIDEFSRPAPQFLDGAVVEMPPGSGAKIYHLPEGDVECVYTIHSEPATLPLAFRAKGVRSVEWRLGLPEADISRLQAFVAAGLTSTDPVVVDGAKIAPRDVLVETLRRQGGAIPDPDARERLRAHVVGTVGGRRVAIDADLAMTQHAEWGTDSGTYSTGVPPAIAAGMLARGEALRTGVGGPESMLPFERFFDELAARGLHAEIGEPQPV